MAKKYVGVVDVSVAKNGMVDIETVGVEVRAKNMRGAKDDILSVLAVAYPNYKLDTKLEVSRLKQQGKYWQPVTAFVSAKLPAVTTWLSPKSVEMSDIKPADNNVVALPKPKEVKVKPKVTVKLKPLGFDEEFVKATGHSVRTYNASNEVEA